MEFSSGRRIFWVFSAALVLLLCSLNNKNGGVEATHQVFMRLQSQPANDVKKLHRTGYHFQPPKHWINDPNGPMYYKGVYHLFYQYNPKGSVWGNIVWAHSVSTDLINWRRVIDAIYPSETFDNYGCWSGSATVQNGVPTILYTGIIDSINTQVQNYAIPKNLSDPLLSEWIKPKDNPLISADPSQNKTSFRDPTTAWMGRDGRWRIVVGSRRRNRGVSYMYRSKNFKKWIKAQHPLHTKDGTGNWECPDFFPVSIYNSNGVETSTLGPNVKHVFKVSLDVTRYEYYTIGTYVTKLDRYIPDPGMVDGWNGLRYDYGNFYASKSFFDPAKQRRILWGWANESDSTDNDILKGWAGIQLIPRTIVLDPSGKQLIQWPVEELETLRTTNVELKDKKLMKGEKIIIRGITPAQADVDVVFTFDSLDKAETFDPSWDKYDGQKICGERDSTVAGGLGPFGLITFASKHMNEYTPVFFRIFKDQTKYRVLLCSDAKRSSLQDPKTYMSNGTAAYRPSFGGFVNVDLARKRLSLRSLIDNSVVESFAEGGKTVITSRVYPIKAIYHKAHLYAFNNGSETIKIESLSAWSMKKPKEMNNNKLPKTE